MKLDLTKVEDRKIHIRHCESKILINLRKLGLELDENTVIEIVGPSLVRLAVKSKSSDKLYQFGSEIEFNFFYDEPFLSVASCGKVDPEDEETFPYMYRLRHAGEVLKYWDSVILEIKTQMIEYKKLFSIKPILK